MFRPLAFLLLPLAAAACASGAHLAQASGRYRALNPTHWTPSSDDLRGVRAPLPPAQSPALQAEPHP